MKKRLLILADLGHLKAFRLVYNAPGLKPKLELITTFSTHEASGRLQEKVTDVPEMFRSDAPPGNMQSVRSSGERHTMKQEFARQQPRKSVSTLAKSFLRSRMRTSAFWPPRRKFTVSS